jgi:single-strand DNA-binding protein
MGRVGKDAECRFTVSGQAVANFSVATSERFIKDGEKQERTEWHDIVFWGKLAEVVGEHVKKGSMVLVEGRIEKHKYQDKDGNDRLSVNIVGNHFEFAGGKSSEGTTGAKVDSTSVAGICDDEVPF